ERVKRLKRSGAIRRTTALVDPLAVGKPLLAFVHVDTRGWGKTPELLAIEQYPEVEEIHTVAGDTCLLLKVRTEGPKALEGLLGLLQGGVSAALRSWMEGGGGPRFDFCAPPGEAALVAADSISWRIFKNPVALFIGGVAAVILELAEPRVRTGVWEHTSFRD